MTHLIVEILSSGVYFYIVGGMAGETVALRFFKQDLLNAAHQGVPVSKAHFFRHRNGSSAPCFFGCVVMLARHFVRGSAGAAGVGEDVHVRKGAFADKGKTLREFLLRLPRESHDHVRGDTAAWKMCI